MNKASPVLPTRPAFAFQGQTTKRRPSPTLHTTKTRRSSHSNSTADRALVAAAAAVAAAVVLQRPKLCSTGAAHGKLWAVMLCVALHNTADDGAAMATATAKPLLPFKSHFEVCYASADRSLTRKSMQRKRKQKACRTFLGQTKCCKCTIINGNETNFPSF